MLADGFDRRRSPSKMGTMSNEPPIPLPAEPYLAYADQLLESIRQNLPKAIEGDDAKAVHHCRVATRRLSAFLEAAKPMLAKPARRRLKRMLKTVRRRLGDVRDADVLSGHLTDNEVQADATAQGWLHRQVSRERAVALESLHDKLSMDKVVGELDHWPTLRREIALSGDCFRQTLSQSLHEQLASFTAAADALANESKEESAGVPTVGRVEPHAVRIAGKALRYTLELAAAGLPQPPEAVLDHFKELQDALGLWHDFVVLAERAMRRSLDCQLAYHDAALQSSVLKAAGLSLSEAQRRLAEFRDLWKARGGAVRDEIHAAFPPEPAEDLKPDSLPPIAEVESSAPEPPCG